MSIEKLAAQPDKFEDPFPWLGLPPSGEDPTGQTLNECTPFGRQFGYTGFAAPSPDLASTRQKLSPQLTVVGNSSIKDFQWDTEQYD